MAPTGPDPLAAGFLDACADADARDDAFIDEHQYGPLTDLVRRERAAVAFDGSRSSDEVTFLSRELWDACIVERASDGGTVASNAHLIDGDFLPTSLAWPEPAPDGPMGAADSSSVRAKGGSVTGGHAASYDDGDRVWTFDFGTGRWVAPVDVAERRNWREPFVDFGHGWPCACPDCYGGDPDDFRLPL